MAGNISRRGRIQNAVANSPRRLRTRFRGKNQGIFPKVNMRVDTGMLFCYSACLLYRGFGLMCASPETSHPANSYFRKGAGC